MIQIQTANTCRKIRLTTHISVLKYHIILFQCNIKSNHIIITFLMYFSDSYMIFSFNFWSNKICSLIFRSTSDNSSSRRHVWMSYNIMVNIYILLSCIVNIFSVFLCYPIMCFYVMSSVLWCPLRFLHKNDVRLFVFVCV